MVGDTNNDCTYLLTEFFKERIAQLAGGHLDAYLPCLRIDVRIKVFPMKWDIYMPAQFLAEQCIPFCFIPANMKVTMDCLQVIAKPLQCQEKCDTVGSTRKSHQKFVFSIKKTLSFDEFGYFFLKRHH